MHHELTNWRGMALQRAFVFEGEISRMEQIRQRKCHSGTEEKLEYQVSEMLWDDPDSYIRKESKISKGYIDCTQQRLPQPFQVGSRVIVFCTHSRREVCVSPVLSTSENLQKVKEWVVELAEEQGDSALLQIHERLVEDGTWMRSSWGKSPQSTFVQNGEIVQPIAFLGEVAWIEPAPKVWTVIPRRQMDLSVRQLVFGNDRETKIRAWCNSIDCGGVAVGMRVIAYCRDSKYSPAECILSTTDPEHNIEKLKKWSTEAFISPEDAAMAETRDWLLGKHRRYAQNPGMYIAEISWIQPWPVGRMVICKSAISQRVEFTVLEVLTGKAPDEKIRTGYINCSPQSLPDPPFSLHARVILYCNERHDGFGCATPITENEERLKKVRSWIAAVSQNTK